MIPSLPDEIAALQREAVELCREYKSNPNPELYERIERISDKVSDAQAKSEIVQPNIAGNDDASLDKTLSDEYGRAIRDVFMNKVRRVPPDFS